MPKNALFLLKNRKNRPALGLCLQILNGFLRLHGVSALIPPDQPPIRAIRVWYGPWPPTAMTFASGRKVL